MVNVNYLLVFASASDAGFDVVNCIACDDCHLVHAFYSELSCKKIPKGFQHDKL